MATYGDLLVNGFYLIKQDETDEIILVQPLMETDACLLLLNLDEYENTFWRKKTDALHELVDELTDEQLAEYEILFEDDDADIDEEDD
jgi:hypothetical protein